MIQMQVGQDYCIDIPGITPALKEALQHPGPAVKK
jgi:hypothetical protein